MVPSSEHGEVANLVDVTCPSTGDVQGPGSCKPLPQAGRTFDGGSCLQFCREGKIACAGAVILCNSNSLDSPTPYIYSCLTLSVVWR